MDSRQQLRRLYHHLRPYRLKLIVGTLLIGTHVILNLAVSLFIGQLIDASIGLSHTTFWHAFIGLMSCWLLGDLIFFSRFRLLRDTSEHLAHDLREAAADTLSRVRIGDLEQLHSGDLISRLSNDMVLVKNLIGLEWLNLVRGIFGFSLALIIMLYYSWSITLASIIIVPLIGWAASSLGKSLAVHTNAQQVSLASLNSLALDSITGITVSKAFNLKGSLSERFRQHAERVATSGTRVENCQGVLKGVMRVLGLLPVFILFGLGGYQVIAGRLTFGTLIVLLNLLNSVTWPLNNMARSLSQAKAALAAAERIFAVLDLPIERAAGAALIIDDSSPAIELENVHFSYSASQKLFSGLSFRIAHGEKVAIVGASGSGKSTILSLLLGLRDIRKGDIRLYGQSLTNLNLASTRRAIAYVPQEPLLFPTSIQENISYGDLDAGKDAITRAAATAYAADFIKSLADGYYTDLGELGGRISGGQRQRLSLARAILRNAPIILLDEATSALDPESEARVQAAVKQLSRNSTALIIAHRLSTIREVDRIIVLDQGEIVEMGTHDDLIHAGGLYSRLYAQQFESPIGMSAAVGK